MIFESWGTLVYEANRNVDNQWWLTLELPYFSEIARYMRWHMDKQWWQADIRSTKRQFHQPPHAYHISVIRGEKPRKNLDRWRKDNGKRIKFTYSNLIRQTTMDRDRRDDVWFVDANFDGYAELRKFYGLDYQRNGVPFRGHITIARAYE